MWNERFKFDIHVPEQVMVRFVVEDYDSTSQNDLIGQYCLPLTSVQNGKIVQPKQQITEVRKASGNNSSCTDVGQEVKTGNCLLFQCPSQFNQSELAADVLLQEELLKT